MYSSITRWSMLRAEDVYTALLGVAFAFVLVGLLYVGWRSNELFGSFMPQPAL